MTNLTQDLPKLLPEAILGMGTSFCADEVVKKITKTCEVPIGGEIDGLNVLVSDFLNDMVWIGILWKIDHTYEFRARPRGLARRCG